MDKCNNCGQTAECKYVCLCGKWGWHTCKDIGLFLLRLSLATVFIYHGYGKLSHMPETIVFFASLGFPKALAWLVALTEVGSGLAMLLGVLVRYAGLAIACVMVVATVKVKWMQGVAWAPMELEFSLLTTGLAISLLGGGRFALFPERNWCKDCSERKGPSQN